jgi:Fe-S-cluster containining protein
MNEICNNCGKCCLETEMILSKKDVEEISKNSTKGLSEADFVFINEAKLYQLKNKKKHCIFLDINSKLCKIYKFRPQGCRFYPIIYDKERRKCIYDKECPRVEKFYLERDDFKKVCSNIKIFLRSELKIDISF